MLNLNLVWADSPVNDLVRLREFIAQENPEAANRAAATIKESVSRLSAYPLIGKPDPDLPDYRDLFIRFGAGGYLLRYRVHGNSIYLLHLRHYREESFQTIDLNYN